MIKLSIIAVTLVLTGCASSMRITATEPPLSTVTGSASTPIVLPTGTSSPLLWPTPNNRLTPGAVVTCTLPRPTSERVVTTAEKNAIAAAYHYTGPRGINFLEFDHRIPFALCGSNGPVNVWPEPYDGAPRSAFVHNRKDQLEEVVIRLVHAGHLTLTQAQQIFRGDWRSAWCHYVRSSGVAC